MKKSIFTFFFSMFLIAGMTGQEVKKHVLIEHFTNSRCGICASKNPVFYNTINQYPGEIHHISYHPPTPYPNCAIYLSNTTGNEARANFYNVSGTPTIKLQGNVNSSGSALVNPSTLSSLLNKTSPIGISVEETTGNDRTVTIKVGSYATVPSGNYLLYAALVEKEFDYNAPNGETVHHDVFRQMLINGVDFELAAEGNAKVITTGYSVGNYDPNELYVVVFLQSDANDEILNSGTKFDDPLTDLPVATSVIELAKTSTFSLFPNPAKEELFISLHENASLNAQMTLLDITGRIVLEQRIPENARKETVDLTSLNTGIYFVKIQSNQRTWTEKLIIK